MSGSDLPGAPATPDDGFRCACHDDGPPMPDGRCATCLLPRRSNDARGDGRCRTCASATFSASGSRVDCGQGHGYNIDASWGCDDYTPAASPRAAPPTTDPALDLVADFYRWTQEAGSHGSDCPYGRDATVKERKEKGCTCGLWDLEKRADALLNGPAADPFPAPAAPAEGAPATCGNRAHPFCDEAGAGGCAPAPAADPGFEALVDALVGAAREEYRWAFSGSGQGRAELKAARSALVSAWAALRAERDEARQQGGVFLLQRDTETRKREHAEARAEAAERERDALAKSEAKATAEAHETVAANRLLLDRLARERAARVRAEEERDALLGKVNGRRRLYDAEAWDGAMDALGKATAAREAAEVERDGFRNGQEQQAHLFDLLWSDVHGTDGLVAQMKIAASSLAAARSEAEGLRRQVEALAKEWEDEATRRETDASFGGRYKAAELRTGAAFERNHAARLRALSAPAATTNSGGEGGAHG